ncbi:MAG: hypothetical protein ACTTKN_03105 [Phocaeicola sp.]|uniref:hypothetical protein n=1 Tax=Phocaeicola TaxID=909656 RepID=UPI00234E8E00|nr:hypothetical protein [Phocaeicola oris]MCE2616694.1 hypothetical protein [Phocaeicola oris]
MKQEDDLLKKVGTKNPFKVPDNYFENFNKNIMEKLPEKNVTPEKEITLWDKVKPWIYMAAMFAGIMLMFKMFNSISEKAQVANNKETAPIEAVDSNNTITDISDQYIETMTDYARMDDYTLYQYLTEADTNY